MDVPKPAKVRITHPSPGVADAFVHPAAVPHWQRTGWRLAEPEPGEPGAQPAAIGREPAGDRLARKTTRRRDSKESE